MDKSPVINDSDDFVPLTPESPPSGAASPVINDSDEFVPMNAPRTAITLPTAPGGVIHAAPPQPAEKLDSVPFEFADIRALAQRILKRAQEQGQAKIDGARKQVAAMEKEAADKAYKEAFPKGEKEGYEKGLKEGSAESAKTIKDAVEKEKDALRKNAAPTSTVLQQIIDALNESKQQLVAQAEGDLLLLALDLAKRLVGHELSVDPEAVRPLATECIGLVTDRTAITVRANPEDCRVLEELIPELKTVFADMGTLHIVADATVERGGIIAATREAEVDMRLATRLAAFEEVILGFSGEAAVAPWSAIPEEAIAAAKAEQTESRYSLYADADPDPNSVSPGEQDLITLEEQTAAPEEQPPIALEEPQPEPAVDPDLAELAELAALAEQQDGAGENTNT